MTEVRQNFSDLFLNFDQIFSGFFQNAATFRIFPVHFTPHQLIGTSSGGRCMRPDAPFLAHAAPLGRANGRSAPATCAVWTPQLRSRLRRNGSLQVGRADVGNADGGGVGGVGSGVTAGHAPPPWSERNSPEVGIGVGAVGIGVGADVGAGSDAQISE